MTDDEALQRLVKAMIVLLLERYGATSSTLDR